MHRLRPAFCVLLILGFSFSIAAQDVVTSAAPVEKIRFAASPTSVQMKIEAGYAALPSARTESMSSSTPAGSLEPWSASLSPRVATSTTSSPWATRPMG
jgi:hypothetical protein